MISGVLCCAHPASGQERTFTSDELFELIKQLREAPATRPATQPAALPQPADLPPWAPRPAPADLVLPPTSTWPRTTPPVFGSILAWLEAECELEGRINDGAFLSETFAPLARLRELALTYPQTAGPAWAKLTIDHPSYAVRYYALNDILDLRNPQLRTPAVRQILFDAGEAASLYVQSSYTFSREVEKGLRRFGKDQLQPLSDAEFVRQLALVMRGAFSQTNDDLFELYLQEVMRRKLNNTGDAMDVEGREYLPHRLLMLRTAKNRSLNQPDPLTFKVVRNPNDPRVLEIELALTDPVWASYDLNPRNVQPFRILVELKFPDGTTQVWTEKRPDRTILQPGKPVRTAVSTALIRRAHTVVVSLPRFPYRYDTEDGRWLDGPRLLSFTQSVEMPALP